jgi:large subunit ribosomal protein L1
MEKEQLDKLSAFINENKGQRKFTQSVDLTVNFTGLDFSKADQRLNMEIKMPNGKGRESSVIFFGDDRNLIARAQAAGAKVILGSEIPSIANDKVRMNELLNNELIAQPTLMPQIAKGLGQFLGPRNKMPKPAIGADIATLIGNVSKSVYIRSKGKYLPTVHCTVGSEKMEAQQIAANIDEVIAAFAKKLGKQHIKSVYVKLTMSKPLRLV